MRAIWFQVLFHSPPGVLFTFPSRYWCTIGDDAYLALGGGPPRFPQGSSCPVVLGYRLRYKHVKMAIYGTLTLFGAPFQAASMFLLTHSLPLRPYSARLVPDTHISRRISERPVQNGRDQMEISRPHDPEVQALRFRLVPVRSPLLGQSHLLSLPEGT